MRVGVGCIYIWSIFRGLECLKPNLVKGARPDLRLIEKFNCEFDVIYACENVTLSESPTLKKELIISETPSH